jgi:Mlc titration factor MtfA (ptsG expression regulator)
MFGFLKSRRRKKLLSEPLSRALLEIIARNVAVYSLLSPSEQQKLIAAARIIAAERPFVACGGQVMSDEVKLTIAAQASLLLLGEEGYYFEKVPSILVYPMAYSRRHSLGTGGPVDEDAGMLGESWQRGSIVLSWPAVLSGGRDATDGQNLVLHEFAHHLDSLDGEMGGLSWSLFHSFPYRTGPRRSGSPSLTETVSRHSSDFSAVDDIATAASLTDDARPSCTFRIAHVP